MLLFVYWLAVPLVHAFIVDVVLAVPALSTGHFGFGASFLVALMFSFVSIPASLVAGAISYLLVRDGASPRWVLSIGSSLYAIGLNLLYFHTSPRGMPASLEAIVLPSWLATIVGLFLAGWLFGVSHGALRSPRNG